MYFIVRTLTAYNAYRIDNNGNNRSNSVHRNLMYAGMSTALRLFGLLDILSFTSNPHSTL